MHGRIPIDPQAAIFPDDSSVIETIERKCAARSGSEGAQWFSRLARFLSPKKPGATLQYLTGEDERSCHRYASGSAEPKVHVLVRMLRSREGWAILEFVMRDCKEPWWVEVRRARAVAKAYDAAAAEQLSLTLE